MKYLLLLLLTAFTISYADITQSPSGVPSASEGTNGQCLVNSGGTATVWGACGSGTIPDGDTANQLLQWSGSEWQAPSNGIGILSSSYVAPTADNHLVQKKYVDDSVGGTSTFTALEDADFTSNNYTFVDDDLAGGFNNLFRVTLAGSTDSTMTMPDCDADNDGKGLAVNYVSGSPKVTVRDSALAEIVVFNHDSDTVTLLCDNAASQWIIRQSTITNTGGIDLDSGNSGVTTMSTLQDFIDYDSSATFITGGVITDNGDGTIDVEAGEVWLRDASGETDELKPYVVTAATGLTPADGEVNNVVIKYNSGNPNYVIQSQSTIINGNNEIPIYVIYRNGNTLDILNYNNQGRNFRKNYNVLEARTNWLQYVTGLNISINSTHDDRFDMTAGALRTAINTYNISAFDGDTDTFTLVYRDGSGGFTLVPNQTDLPDQFDDGDGTPAAISGSRRGVFWVASSADGSTYYVIMGHDEYGSIGAARDVLAPEDPTPPFVDDFGTASVQARVIYQNDAILEVAAFRDAKTAIAAGSIHNDLAGLNEGDYKHLTQAEYTALAGVDTANIAYQDESNTFDKSQTIEIADVATPVNHWKLQETSGTTVEDFGSADTDLTNAGATVDQTGKISKAYDFNGSTNYLSIASARNDSVGSYSAWIYREASGSFQSLYSSADEATNVYNFNIAISTSNKLTLFVRNNTVTSYLESTNIVPLNAWSHVVVTSNGSTTKMYINNSEETLIITGGTNGGFWMSDVLNRDNTNIGRTERSDTVDYFTGLMEDIRLYDSALSADDVESIYNENVGILDTDLAHLDSISLDTNANMNARRYFVQGTNINTGGTLSNVAYLDQANTFSTNIVVNEGGNDADTRIEGDTDANLVSIDAGNNRVGIGTNAPTHKLHVSGSGEEIRSVVEATDSNEATLQVKTPVADWGIYASNVTDFLGFYSYNQTKRIFTIEADGDVGIGALAPSARLHIQDAGVQDILIESTNANEAQLKMKNTTSDWIQFTGVSSDEIGFYSNNQSSTMFRIRANGEIVAPETYNNTTASASNMYITSAGIHQRSTSLEELKTILKKPINSELIYELKPIQFYSLLPSDNPSHKYFGFGARHTESVSKSFATYGEDGEVNNYDSRAILAAAVQAIQEQKKEIDELKTRVKLNKKLLKTICKNNNLDCGGVY
jgi:hypothetical protein